MAENAKKSPHLCVDGKWFPCLPAGEFGFLGGRILCEFNTEAGQPPKKLLVRPLKPQEMEVDRIADGRALGLRPIAVKTYQYAVPSPDRKLVREDRQFLQQEITGLLTLREATLKVVKDGSPRKVWHLFYSACKALNGYAKAVGGQRLVPLQCPNGLAVDAKTGQVIILDGELKAPTISDSNDAAFLKWFGASGRNRYAQGNDASLLHSKALLLFFREVLGYLGESTVTKQLGIQLDQLAAARSPQELEANAEAFGEDWSIPAGEESGLSVAVLATPKIRPTIRHEKPRSWLGWFLGSFLANLLLAALIVILLAILWPTMKPAAESPAAESPAAESPAVQLSSYCVIFPAQGTSSENVLTALKQLYSDRLLLPKPGESEQFLSDQLDLLVKPLKDLDKVHKLVAKMNSDHSIRFNGFSPEAEDVGLRSIIANGGVYKIVSSPENVQQGSLLRPDSVDRILAMPGMEKQADARTVLESLKVAIQEYASIKDAVTMVSNRTGFIVRVEPTVKGHEVVRKQLLGIGTPVFVPRPVFEVFDAVNPAAGTGGGVARYSLKLDRKCEWRLVGSDDRRKTDYKNNPSNEKMKWSSVPANQEIVWTTLPVLRQNGRTDSVSSFDIAIAVNDKVVIFRNQSILTGESRNDILKQARVYLDNLGFNKLPIEDAVTIRQQAERYTGALLYNYFAEHAKESRDDLEILTQEHFENTRKREDNYLTPESCSIRLMHTIVSIR